MARTKGNGGSRPEGTPGPDVVPVVGIGASAGGLSALESLLPAIKPGSGFAFVIVQHLDPDHESALTMLLDRLATIPVSLIKDDTPVRADHIYVIPPNSSLTISEDRLHLAA